MVIILVIFLLISAIVVNVLSDYLPKVIHNKEPSLVLIFKQNIRNYDTVTLLTTLMVVIMGSLVYYINTDKPIGEIVCYLILSNALILLFVIDYKTKLLPDIITLPVMWLGIVCNMLYGSTHALQSSIIGAMVGYLSLWIMYWVYKLIKNKEGLGYGDFKLFALIGAWFGVESLSPIMLIAAMSALIILGISLIKHRPISEEIAFGPYLIIGTLGYTLLW